MSKHEGTGNTSLSFRRQIAELNAQYPVDPADFIATTRKKGQIPSSFLDELKQRMKERATEATTKGACQQK
jgi:hypothetical protein